MNKLHQDQCDWLACLSSQLDYNDEIEMVNKISDDLVKLRKQRRKLRKRVAELERDLEVEESLRGMVRVAHPGTRTTEQQLKSSTSPPGTLCHSKTIHVGHVWHDIVPGGHWSKYCPGVAPSDPPDLTQPSPLTAPNVSDSDLTDLIRWRRNTTPTYSWEQIAEKINEIQGREDWTADLVQSEAKRLRIY